MRRGIMPRSSVVPKWGQERCLPLGGSVFPGLRERRLAVSAAWSFLALRTRWRHS